MKNKSYKNKEWLYKKYVEERLSLEKIARACRPKTTAPTILRWMKIHGIETRTLSDAVFGIKHRGKRIGKDTFRNKEWMIQKYIKENLSGEQIATLCGVARHTIINYLKRHGIKVRPSCPRKGEKNPFWKGGSKAYGERRRKTKEYKEYQEKWRDKHPDHMTERCRKMKQRAIEYKGGKCLACPIEFDGNNACIFDFHHRDPNEKEINIGALMSRKWEKIKEELDKTDLMCSNCHRLKHNGG